jgi:hypothetical protein
VDVGIDQSGQKRGITEIYWHNARRHLTLPNNRADRLALHQHRAGTDPLGRHDPRRHKGLQPQNLRSSGPNSEAKAYPEAAFFSNFLETERPACGTALTISAIQAYTRFSNEAAANQLTSTIGT